MNLVIAAPAGLVTADFAFALYLNGTAISASGVTVSELSTLPAGSDYLVSGLPDAGDGEQIVLTWNTGVASDARRYPILPSTPPNIVIPARVAGLTLSALNAKLYLDGTAVSTAALTLTAQANNDYLLGGLANPAPGSFYTLVYSFGPALYTETWPQPVAGINMAYGAPSAFVHDFLDEMPDIVLGQYVLLDGKGGLTPSGAVVSYPCRISGGAKLTRDMAGREFTSTRQVVVGGTPRFDPKNWRYTLPARFPVRLNLTAILVEQWTDEDGECYEKVWLP